MFKRFTLDEVSSQSQIKSSVGRGIRSTILELYPDIEEVLSTQGRGPPPILRAALSISPTTHVGD